MCEVAEQEVRLLEVHVRPMSRGSQFQEGSQFHEGSQLICACARCGCSRCSCEMWDARLPCEVAEQDVRDVRGAVAVRGCRARGACEAHESRVAVS